MQVSDPLGKSQRAHLNLQGMSTVSGTVGLNTNGMSAGSTSLLGLGLERRQAGRHQLPKRQHLKGALVTHRHQRARNWRKRVSGMKSWPGLWWSSKGPVLLAKGLGLLYMKVGASPQLRGRSRRDSYREASRFQNPVFAG